ncbi:MAG: polyprenyl synthetase family protein [Acidobacteria bacterium]|nr:polyprenyl synthetase family protein [Acidobacteriota bacterium]
MLERTLHLRIDADRLTINAELERLLSSSVCADAGPVERALGYAVLGSGQRVRPILAMRVGRLLGADPSLTLRAACAVEMLHCASLIVDDLPCMDNELVRRGRPTVHREFGEPTALLGAFALVALAARVVVEQRVPDHLRERQRLFQIQLLSTLDCSGLIAGQSMDLTLSGDVREFHRIHMHELKTVPLFDLAVQAGMAYAPSDVRIDEGLRRFGREFGVAFQVADDLVDGEIDDYAVVEAQLDRARHCLVGYGEDAASVSELLDYLNARSLDHCHR